MTALASARDPNGMALLSELPEARPIGLVEFSVVLVGEQVEPSMINPDFLLHSGIVDAGLEVARPSISTPVFAQIVFDNGLEIRAEPKRFVFQQHGDPLLEEECICADVAIRLVSTFSYLPYSAVGINPKAFRPVDAAADGGMRRALTGEGKWSAFRDILPDVSLKAVYEFESRAITLTMSPETRSAVDGSESTGLSYSANIHRDVGDGDREGRLSKTTGILKSWKNDLSDFFQLIERFG